MSDRDLINRCSEQLERARETVATLARDESPSPDRILIDRLIHESRIIASAALALLEFTQPE